VKDLEGKDTCKNIKKTCIHTKLAMTICGVMQWYLSHPFELYGNAVTGGHYHLKGQLKNTLPETRSGFENILASFEDKTINSTVDSESGSMNIVMNPNTTVPFDIKTIYTADKAKQFQFMKVQITP
jgi:hypothetical protein